MQLPDEFGLEVGQILIARPIEGSKAFRLELHKDQNLSDEQIEEDGFLTRVIEMNT